MSSQTCPAAQRLHARLTELGWTAKLTYARGPVEFTEYDDPRGDGTRPKVQVLRELDSALVRGCAPGGWAIVALWIQDGVTAKGSPKWATDMVYIPGRHAPQRIGASSVRAYLDSYLNRERRAAA